TKLLAGYGGGWIGTGWLSVLQTMKNHQEVAEKCGDSLRYFQTDVWPGYPLRLTLPRKHPRLTGHHLCMRRFSARFGDISPFSSSMAHSAIICFLRHHSLPPPPSAPPCSIFSFLPIASCYLSAASTPPEAFPHWNRSARSNPYPPTL